MNQIVVLNLYSNCKPMIIIQNAYSLTQVDYNALNEMCIFCRDSARNAHKIIVYPFITAV